LATAASGTTGLPDMDGWNYFNYFTEIEEYFWKKRGAHLLVSPLDWAIMETWQKAGVPLEAVLKGIDSAFESYGRSRRGGGKPLKSLAYCTDAVLDAVTEIQEAAAGATPKSKKAAPQPFSADELRAYFDKNLAKIAATTEKLGGEQPDLVARLTEISQSLSAAGALLDTPSAIDLEDLERRLTILDEKLQSALTQHATEDQMLRIRREIDSQLVQYRRKMKAEQIALVERQLMQKRLLEEFGLPRLSLYYFS
jgi:hypothetical protein